jgi:hypothetical protein
MDQQPVEYTRPRRRGPSIVGPLILIVLGVVFLLNTMEVLPWNVWESLWRLWPLVLVLIGLELLLGRGNPWLSGLIAVFVIGAALVLILLTGVLLPVYRFGAPLVNGQGQPVVVQTSEIQVPLAGARQASVTVRFGAGQLDLSALPGDTGSLVEGSLTDVAGRSVAAPRVTRQGDRVDVSIQGPEGGSVIPSVNQENLQLRLNSGLPLDLRLQGGATTADLDLRQLQGQNLYVELGASTVRVQLPEAAGTTQAQFKTGMATLNIEVPSKVAARITSRGGLSSFKIDERRFPKQGNYYVSPGYDTAPNKVDIDIDAGMASVTVQ